MAKSVTLEVEELKSRFRALGDDEWLIALKYAPSGLLVDEVKRRLIAEQDVIRNVHKAISGKDMDGKDGDLFEKIIGTKIGDVESGN